MGWFGRIRAFALVTIFTLTAFFPLTATHAALPEDDDIRLTADSMEYDPDSGSVFATGNVRFTRSDCEIFGDSGTGSLNGREFEMRGSVRGTFKEESLDVVCASLGLTNEGGTPPRRRISASGDVVLTRRNDRLSANTVTWDIDMNSYKASGKVVGAFANHSIDSDLIERDEDRFWASNIRNYEDKDRRIRMSAAKANGLIKDGDVVELIADGNITVDMPDKNGEISRVTGSKGVFSLSRGTIVISGNAAVKQGKRRLSAGNIVYHLDSGRIEALGQPSIVFEMPEN